MWDFEVTGQEKRRNGLIIEKSRGRRVERKLRYGPMDAYVARATYEAEVQPQMASTLPLTEHSSDPVSSDTRSIFMVADLAVLDKQKCSSGDTDSVAWGSPKGDR